MQEPTVEEINLGFADLALTGLALSDQSRQRDFAVQVHLYNSAVLSVRCGDVFNPGVLLAPYWKSAFHLEPVIASHMSRKIVQLLSSLDFRGINTSVLH